MRGDTVVTFNLTFNRKLLIVRRIYICRSSLISSNLVQFRNLVTYAYVSNNSM